MTRIAIVDYGMGNFHSVARALQAAAPDHDIRIARSADEIRAADRIVFPGQGAMPDCMRTLDTSGLREAVLQAAREKPLLGVCVGEQMLFQASDEGNISDEADLTSSATIGIDDFISVAVAAINKVLDRVEADVRAIITA